MAARSSSESKLDCMALVLRADFFLSLMAIPPVCKTSHLDRPDAQRRAVSFGEDRFGHRDAQWGTAPVSRARDMVRQIGRILTHATDQSGALLPHHMEPEDI